MGGMSLVVVVSSGNKAWGGLGSWGRGVGTTRREGYICHRGGGN